MWLQLQAVDRARRGSGDLVKTGLTTKVFTSLCALIRMPAVGRSARRRGKAP
jgi:hypothetical protein